MAKAEYLIGQAGILNRPKMVPSVVHCSRVCHGIFMSICMLSEYVGYITHITLLMMNETRPQFGRNRSKLFLPF